MGSAKTTGVTVPITTAESLQRLRIKGARGHFHIAVSGDTTYCGRKLHMPEVGATLDEATGTGRDWSPRCLTRLRKVGLVKPTFQL